MTVLHLAVSGMAIEMTMLLVSHGACLDAQDDVSPSPRGIRVVIYEFKYGRTALHVAALSNYADIAQELLEHGADPNIKDHVRRDS